LNLAASPTSYRLLVARRTSRPSVHRSWKPSFRTSSEPPETNKFPCWMSTQQAAPKPSLTGVRIKARKGAVKAQAKHEPAGKPLNPDFTLRQRSAIASAVVESRESGHSGSISRIPFYNSHLFASPTGEVVLGVLERALGPACWQQAVILRSVGTYYTPF